MVGSGRAHFDGIRKVSVVKVLILANRIPAPSRKGDQIVAFYRIQALLKAGYVVELVSFGDEKSPEDRSAAIALKELGVTVHLVRWRVGEAMLRLSGALLSGMRPFQVSLFQSSAFYRLVDERLAAFRPDMLHCVLVRSFQYANAARLPVVLDLVDSMSLNFTRRGKLARGPVRWLLRMEEARIGRYERLAAQSAHVSFVVSTIDKDHMNAERVVDVPLGLDESLFRDRNHAAAFQDKRVVFSGNMGYEPNVTAILWFVKHCWPSIRQQVPASRLQIVGASPHPKILALRGELGVEVTGRVDSVADYLSSAAVAVAPMQSGSGMQFKVLEAMAAQTPVVATKLGLGAIGAEPGSEIMVEDDSVRVAIAVVNLLTDSGLNNSIGAAGCNYVKRAHTWEAVNDVFLAHLPKKTSLLSSPHMSESVERSA